MLLVVVMRSGKVCRYKGSSSIVGQSGNLPDIEAPRVDVDEGRLDVNGLGPDGQSLSQDLNYIGLKIDGSCSGIKAAGAGADHAGVVVDADSLRIRRSSHQDMCRLAMWGLWSTFSKLPQKAQGWLILARKVPISIILQ